MKLSSTHTGLIGLGFLLGSAGLKMLTSERAKNIYVKGIAEGIKIKSSAEELVERAKENVDDLVAEAEHVADQQRAEKIAHNVVVKAEKAVSAE